MHKCNAVFMFCSYCQSGTKTGILRGCNFVPVVPINPALYSTGICPHAQSRRLLVVTITVTLISNDVEDCSGIQKTTAYIRIEGHKLRCCSQNCFLADSPVLLSLREVGDLPLSTVETCGVMSRVVPNLLASALSDRPSIEIRLYSICVAMGYLNLGVAWGCTALHVITIISMRSSACHAVLAG